jgi:hypothetical protein
MVVPVDTYNIIPEVLIYARGTLSAVSILLLELDTNCCRHGHCRHETVTTYHVQSRNVAVVSL